MSLQKVSLIQQEKLPYLVHIVGIHYPIMLPMKLSRFCRLLGDLNWCEQNSSFMAFNFLIIMISSYSFKLILNGFKTPVDKSEAKKKRE